MIAKRLMDVLIGAVVLLITSPVQLLIWLAVRLESRGPGLFRQERVGRGGQPFLIHKFRTMTVGETGPLITAGNDRRVTRVGRLLRRSKLDELPQLFDVLAGHMSLVGPRPEMAKYVDLWPENARDRILSVRPGITDPATLVFRNEESELARSVDPERHYIEQILPRKAAMYVDYVQNRSLRGDLRILAETVKKVVRA